MSRHRLIALVALTAILSAAPARRSCAGWLVNGAEVCIADSSQQHSTITTDGMGGAIVAWVDRRGGYGAIYAQRMNGAGGELWTAGGVQLCTAENEQITPAIVTDNAGGAIVAWAENLERIGIHAQRVDSTGARRWTNSGVQLSQYAWEARPKMVSDGAGGAIVTWTDVRGQQADEWKVYAQRLDSNGDVHTGWTAGGVALETVAGREDIPTIVSDGTGGAIVAWASDRNNRGNAVFDIYAQHVSASGGVATTDGVALCTEEHNQSLPAIASDGAGGAIVSWQDERDFTNSGTDIYAQHLLASGSVDQDWTANGVALCTAPDGESATQIASDGAGGAIITWQDGRNAANSGTDIYVQHVLDSGDVDPDWIVNGNANGKALCTALGDQGYPAIVEDGAGGAIVTWQDARNLTMSGIDIYAQRVNGGGTLLWTSYYDANGANNGVALCEAAGNQLATAGDPTIASDGAGGAIVAWQDQRTSTDGDIYARRAHPPEAPTVDDVMWASTFIQVAWTGPGDVGDVGTPLRWVVYVDGDSVGGTPQAPGIEQVAEVQGFTACTYHELYVRVIGQHGFVGAASNTVYGQTCCGETCEQWRAPARAQGVEQNYPLALGSPHPNPARDGTEIRWSVPRERAGERFQLALFDVGGRKVTTVAEGNAEVGTSTRKLRSPEGVPLANGVYFLRLQLGRQQLTRSLIVAH